MKINKRRAGILAGGIGAVGALAALSLGGTSALFTSQADGQNNTITAGTVTLTKDVAKSYTLSPATGFMPGDTSNVSKYTVDYAGQDAFVGLDMKITSTAAEPCAAVAGITNLNKSALLANCTGTGTVPMFNGDPNAGSLDMAILPQNGTTAHQLFNPGDLEPGTVCDADSVGLVTCTVTKNNVILPPGSMTTPITADELVWKTGKEGWVTLQASLPIGAPNQYQGSNVTVDLVAHAVQYANNHDAIGNVGSAGTTLPNGIFGTGGQAPAHFPKSWS
jgi:predicted ribosomally synthesized peptide with SipW-like signal peptide